MRRPDVAASRPQSPPARGGLRARSGAVPALHATDSGGGGGSGAWALPPLNQFMRLPGRFLTARFGGGADGGNRGGDGSGATLDIRIHNADWAASTRVLPHIVRFQDEPGAGELPAPAQPPEEIDLTVSSSEDEGGAREEAATATGDSDDVIEILEPTETAGAPQPAPMRRKRRRPAPGAASGNAALVPKRQRPTDMMRSAESTNISMHNSEVIEEFKHRLKCSICLDVLEDMTSTLCGHIFCAGCIHQAIRANGKCPLCQRRLHLKDTHRLFF